jgi:6-pyruvoyltetrahydropterin/6-carboxytetrahydropterin synthase
MDHKHLNELPFFSGINPSAENIAKYIYDEMELKVKTSGVNVARIKIWESENAAVAYIPE